MLKIVTRLGWFALFLLVLAILLGLVGCQSKNTFNSIDVTGATWGKNFSLPNVDGKYVDLTGYRGNVVAVFFGFLSCPDACPSSLNTLARVKKSLGENEKKFKVIFVTIDSDRDTPEKLKNYLMSFDSEFIGLIAKEENLDFLKEEFKLVVQKIKNENVNDFYLIDHTTHIYLFDKNSSLRLVSTQSLSYDKLLSDIKLLLDS